MPRPSKSKKRLAPPDGAPAETQQRIVGDLMSPTDPNAPTRVMRAGGDDTGPRPGSPALMGNDLKPDAPAGVEGSDTGPSPRRSGGARISGLGSGLLARQPAPAPGAGVNVRKLCPHCGNEYETDARFCPKDGAALRPTGGSDPLIGHTLGDRYHILSLVGEGGMGRIYLAEHVRMNRQCAVKIMRPNLVNDADAAARFAREASSAARIIHPNVAAVFDYGESDGHIYLVMEFVDGESLGAILQAERVLSVPRAVEIGRQVADALASAHELGIVHRDLKPDNILIARAKSGREVAKVVDFGIAKAIGEGTGHKLTETGLVIGTPEFMSPEQLMGDPVDARSDVYSLGCILYLMLVGVPAADAPTREGMLKRRLNEHAPHPRKANDTLPPELDAIVVKTLATSANDRFQSAAELRDVLAAFAATVPSADAVPAQVPDITSPTQPMLSHERIAMAPAATLMRRPGVGAGVLVLALMALFLMGRDWGKGPAAPNVAEADSVGALARPTVEPAGGTPEASDTLPALGAGALTTGQPVRTPAERAADSARADSAQRAARASQQLRSNLQTPIANFARAVSSKDIGQLRRAFPGLTPQQENGWQNNFSQFDRIEATPRMGAPVISAGGNAATLDFTLQIVMIDAGGTRTPVASQYRAVYARRNGSWVLSGFEQQRP